MENKSFYTNKKIVLIIATICCILWGSAYPAIKLGYSFFNIATNDIPTKLIFAGYRFTLAGIIVLLISKLFNKAIFNINKKDIFQMSFLGIIQTSLQYLFFYIGLSYTSGIRGSIINGTSAFFTIILASIFFKNDKLNFNKFIGCILGFTGVILVSITTSSNGGNINYLGDILVALSALSSSIAFIYTKKICKDKDAFIITGYQLFIGGFILTIIGFILGGNLSGFTLKSTLLLIYMALISSIAFTLWSELLKYNKVGSISMFNFLIPVFGSILSAIFLGENIFNIWLLLSLILVSLGIFLVYSDKRSFN